MYLKLSLESIRVSSIRLIELHPIQASNLKIEKVLGELEIF